MSSTCAIANYRNGHPPPPTSNAKHPHRGASTHSWSVSPAKVVLPGYLLAQDKPADSTSPGFERVLKSHGFEGAVGGSRWRQQEIRGLYQPQLIQRRDVLGQGCWLGRSCRRRRCWHSCCCGINQRSECDHLRQRKRSRGAGRSDCCMALSSCPRRNSARIIGREAIAVAAAVAADPQRMSDPVVVLYRPHAYGVHRLYHHFACPHEVEAELCG